ncbi:hypothetical protein [Mycetocola sp.]|uniref:hypothetical protein n=1 Tax=Mycetocola sp. TaxID=1871042 RepID=UPI003988F587
MLRGSTLGIVACLLGAVTLTSCTPAPRPTSTPTSTAIFASEDEALAAATDVYQRYTAQFDKDSANGDGGAEAMVGLVTPAYLEKLEVPGLLEENNWHTQGVTTFDNVSLVEKSESDQLALVRLRLCRDVSGVRILDSGGADVTPATRLERFPVEVEFVSSAPREASLLIADSGSWTGDDFC